MVTIPRVEKFTYQGEAIVSNYKWQPKGVPHMWTDGDNLLIIDKETRNVGLLSACSCFAGQCSGFRLEYHPPDRYTEDIGTFFYDKKKKQFMLIQW